METLLYEVVNGHKIVGDILDDCVTATSGQEDSNDFAIKIDWTELDTALTQYQNDWCYQVASLRVHVE